MTESQLNESNIKSKGNFQMGLLSGFIISILTSIIGIWFQHHYTIKEKTIQLYLDEKKEFSEACDDFLRQYRTWHELMNYFASIDSDSIDLNEIQAISEFDNRDHAIKTYRQWKKDIDFAYGKIFILSDNEFGYKTLEVSTVLHGSLIDIISSSKSPPEKQYLLFQIDNYFFENWLLKAQEEIFRFNSGTRRQKSIPQVVEELKEQNIQDAFNDSINTQLYERLLNVHKYTKRQDSINGKNSNHKMPTREEFYEFVDPRVGKKEIP